jgi:hypothetical protein
MEKKTVFQLQATLKSIVFVIDFFLLVAAVGIFYSAQT